MIRLERYICPYWGYIILTMLIKLLGAVMELLIPYLMEILLDVKVPEGNLRDIYWYGLLMLLAAGGCLGTEYAASRRTHGRGVQRLY